MQQPSIKSVSESREYACATEAGKYKTALSTRTQQNNPTDTAISQKSKVHKCCKKHDVPLCGFFGSCPRSLAQVTKSPRRLPLGRDSPGRGAPLDSPAIPSGLGHVCPSSCMTTRSSGRVKPNSASVCSGPWREQEKHAPTLGTNVA